jgi:rhamnosyltransferase
VTDAGAATAVSASPGVGDVCAVLVTHRPELAVLGEALASLDAQVGHVVVVDNASPGDALRASCAARPRASLLALPENLGLAHALNAGIDHARSLAGVTHVLFLDQDSVPAPDMVPSLLRGLEKLSSRAPVAAVGPCFRDARESADAPFVRIRFPFNRKLYCGDRCESIRCDFLITSGCLVPLAVLGDVGDMDASLFIDNVDLDWCFRATAAGYGLHGICAAKLSHRLGDTRKRLPGVSRGIVVHAPRRLFYMMRNRLLLYRRAYTPARWIAQDVPRLVVKLLLFALLVPPRRRNLRCMLAGLKAGIAGRATAPPDID